MRKEKLRVQCWAAAPTTDRKNYRSFATDSPWSGGIYPINPSKCGKVQIYGNDANTSNCIHEKINSTINSGNACYNAVRNILSSRLLSKNVHSKCSKLQFTCYDLRFSRP
jgi:hypothetical protein